jgi:hypothetical protein
VEADFDHLTCLLCRTTISTVSTQEKITKVCDEVKRILLEKNLAYGDSALSPRRVFSKASTEEQLLVRIDDKISRLVDGHAGGEDALVDLIGYLVLLKIARCK